MSKHFARSALTVPFCLLAACGGGGGGANTEPQPLEPTAFTIDENNAQEVSSDLWYVVDFGDFGDIGEGLVAGGVVVERSARTGFAQLAQELVLEYLAADASEQAAVAGGVIISDTVACTQGGTAAVEINDADDSGTDSIGDTASIQFSQCREDGDLINGGFSFAITALSGSVGVTADWRIGVQITFDNFSLDDTLELMSVDGTMDMDLVQSGGVTGESDLSIGNLVLGQAANSWVLQNMSATAEEDYNSLAYSLSQNGTVDSDQLGERFTVQTLVPLTGVDLSGNAPDAGSLRITAANGSNVTLVAVGGGLVRLEIDSDGNGVAETTIDTSWDELSAG